MRTRADRESAARISDCVLALLNDQPFFGSLALRLPIRPDRSRQTLASDGKEIRYSPDWVATTDAHLIKTAIGRVVLACALKHHTRRGDRDPERWQRASQLVTHHLLKDAGFQLPPDAEAWADLSAEEAYDRLPEPDPDDEAQPPPSPSGSPPPPPAGAGDGSDDRDGTPSPTPNTPGDPHTPSNDAPGGDPDTDTETDTDPGESPSSDPSGTGEIMDAAPGADTSGNADAPDFTQEEQDWDEAMHQALNLARAQGNAPGAVKETIDAAHRSTLDWRSLLRRYMTDSAARDYSWSAPNRRFIDSGLYLPSIRSEGMDAIAIIIDSSGSVDRDMLAAFWSEIRNVAAEIEPERVIVLQVDAALQDEQHYHPHELPLRIDVKGRYGTDFRPGFTRLAEQHIRPAVCLYFTDMDCSDYPDTRPDFPVVWVNYGPRPSERNREPWGERIDIPTPRTRNT
ncbi:MAG: VWA-like domain-containing protein [Defluviicoccus sp.]|nr:VWA-like domain-containing protein [Defluviicoccus sp.]